MRFRNSKCDLSLRIAASPLAKCALVLAGFAGLAVTVCAGAADAPRPTNKAANNFEITPFIGYMSGGKFEDPLDGSDRDLKEDTTFGLFADIVADVPERHYEFLYASQGSTVKGATPLDLDVQYLHIGGTVGYMDNPHITPFFGATVGATRFSPDASGLDDETKVSFSLGGGVKVPITDHIGLRFDVRAFITLLDTDSEIFCVSDAVDSGCRISAKSDTFLQYAAGLGITAAF